MKNCAFERMGSFMVAALVVVFIFGIIGTAIADPSPPRGVRRIEIRKQVVHLGEVLREGKYRVYVNKNNGTGWKQYVTNFIKGGPRYITDYPGKFSYDVMPGTMDYNVNPNPSLGRSWEDNEFALDIDNRDISVEYVTFAFQRIATGAPLGTVWSIVGAGGWTAVWTRRGTGKTFDCVWTGPQKERVTTVVNVEMDGRSVRATRTSSSDGILCRYTGNYEGPLQGSGGSIRGTAKCDKGGPWNWSATIR